MLCVCSLCKINFTSKIIKQTPFTPQPDHLGIKTRSVLKSAWHQLQLLTIWLKLPEASFGSYKALNIPQNGLAARMHTSWLPENWPCVTRLVLKININMFVNNFWIFNSPQCFVYSSYVSFNFAWEWQQNTINIMYISS